MCNKKGYYRVPSTAEREMMLGFPLHYTAACSGKSERKQVGYNDIRLTLHGEYVEHACNCVVVEPIVVSTRDGRPYDPSRCSGQVHARGVCLAPGRRVRMPIRSVKSTRGDAEQLAGKLGNLISLKGEDILISTPSMQLVKFHRLRPLSLMALAHCVRMEMDPGVVNIPTLWS